MAYSVINKTGCCERKGNVQVRLDFYLEPEDPRYNELYLELVDTKSSEYLAGYKGKVDKQGNPIDQADYDKWYDSLPKVWQNTPFHSHFLYFDPDVTGEDIKAEMDFHLPNFYKAFQDGRDKEQGGMRHGWAVEKRIPPLDYSQLDSAENYTLRKAQCEDRVTTLSKISSSPSIKEGQEYPSTDIDIGAAATDRISQTTAGRTYLCTTNPANATGTIDTYELYPLVTMSGTNKVGTFSGSGTSYDDRDYETIGTATAGAKRTFTGLDITVAEGDFAGFYASVGSLARSTSTYVFYYKSGDQFGKTAQTYTEGTGNISLYGTGDNLVIPTVTTQACTGVQAEQVTANGNITDAGGENCHTRGFCYKQGTSGDPTTSDSKVYDNGGGSYGTGAYNKNITGLTQGTGYRVRAYAINSIGTGYGTTVQVTTTAVYEVSVTDGLSLGDSLSNNAVLNAVLTDGFKGGDSLARQSTLNAVLTDGAKLGDTPLAQLVFDVLLSDGFTGGDTPSVGLLFQQVLTDGIKLGDALSMIRETNPVLTDGVKLGDTPSTLAVLNALISEGLKLGDSPSTLAVLNASLSDGMDLGDTPAIFRTIGKVLTDGIKLGDSLSMTLTIGLTVADGVDLGDSLATQAVLNGIITEGIDLGDTPSTTAILNATLADGVDFGDTVAGNLIISPIITDGLTLGDALAIAIYHNYIAQKYIIELRDSDGNLVARLKHAYGIDYKQTINAPHYLKFQLPATDDNASSITLANEIWLRDMKSDTVLRKFKLRTTRDKRE